MPSFEIVVLVENVSVLLLEFPQTSVDVKGAAKVGLPLVVAVAVLWQLSSIFMDLIQSIASKKEQ